MSGANIRVNDHGPYVITGAFEVVDVEGNTIETKKAISLCRCGYSENKPFCDGTHKQKKFESVVRANDE